MTSTTSVHLDKNQDYDVDVGRSSSGSIWLEVRGLTIFCTPEQAVKLASDILHGVLALPPAQPHEAKPEETPAQPLADADCPF